MHVLDDENVEPTSIAAKGCVLFSRWSDLTEEQKAAWGNDKHRYGATLLEVLLPLVQRWREELRVKGNFQNILGAVRKMACVLCRMTA